MKLRGFLVGASLALGLALTACGGGDSGGTTSATAAPVVLTVSTDPGVLLQFEPKTLTAQANTPVQLTFNNKSDTLPHDLAFKEVITAKTDVNVAPGASQTISFTTPGPGTYTYTCTIHPGMEGVLTVQ